jgi:hypothetical protein
MPTSSEVEQKMPSAVWQGLLQLKALTPGERVIARKVFSDVALDTVLDRRLSSST